MRSIMLPTHRMITFTLGMDSMLGIPPPLIPSQRGFVSLSRIISFVVVFILSPGRFFAVTELKLMLAYTLLNFDVKTKEGQRPPNVEIFGSILPNMKAEILYRRRTPPAGLETDASP